MSSLWGEEFTIKETPKEAKKILKKIKEPKSPEVKTVKDIKSKKVSIEDKLKLITDNVNQILGRYKESTLVIKTREELHSYIDKAIENNVIAIDTETNNSLDPLTCILMGPCIYTPGLKNAYIPLNHVNVNTRERLSWQLTEQDILEEFSRLDTTLIVMHNGKFDYQVIKCTLGKELKIYWDTMIAARIIDENERSAGLKQQYIEKIDPSIEKYSIDHLFEDIEYALVDPEIFALYAATDSFMTYKLYEWQKLIFEQKGNEKLYNLFKTVEMPVVTVTAEMELTGIEVDIEYGQRLSKKYHNKLDAIDIEIEKELSKYRDKINAWRLTDDAKYKPPKKAGEGLGKSKDEQLEDPVNLSSPTQLAIFIYDILRFPVMDKKKPRGTGEEILEQIKEPWAKLLLERRGLLKLINTYIDTIPTLINPKTGRLHTHFNQIGADTGRFSSSKPINLQNIPSHNKEIRMLFKAKDGYVMIGSDFSQQEPRLLSNYSRDENMINAYKQGKDLYATIAAGVYKNDYWDNMEFTDETKTVPNPEGKKRRSSCKSLLLGIMYGRGVASIAEQINGTVQEAQKIVDDFFTSFPKVKKWINDTQESAKRLGYVEDCWGRRRRLPDILLPKYEVKDLSVNNNPDDNPILDCKNIVTTIESNNVKKYKEALTKCKNRKEFEILKEQALKQNIQIIDNSGFIAQAERQCVNARVQGGAASMSKCAMRNVHNDPILKELGFKLLVAVHDELIGECPIENQDKAADRLCEIMKKAAEDVCDVPFKCDPTIEHCWYFSDFKDMIQSKMNKLMKDKTWDEAFKIMVEECTESTEDQLHELLDEFKIA